MEQPKQGQRLNWVEHLLKRPDTKIGSIDNTEELVWIYDEEKKKIVKRKIMFNSAFERIIIEPISNAIDNKWESDKMNVPMSIIKFSCDKETGRITLWNDGRWIPVELKDWPHKDPKTGNISVETLYPAEVYFGEDLSGTNYDDNEIRMTSGRNGIGAKATNVFSTEFNIICADPINKKTFKQTYRNNMSIRDKPKISRCTLKKGYTEISWVPDYKKFDIETLSNDWMGLIKRHAYETAMITGLNVLFNGEKLGAKTLLAYAKMILENKAKIISLNTSFSGERCEIVLAENVDNEDFNHISFVNGALTRDGGVHVKAWKDVLLGSIRDGLNSRKKNIRLIKTDVKNMKITQNDIEKYFMIFVKAELSQPAFESQSKNKLVKPKPSTIKLTDVQLKQVLKWKFVSDVDDIIQSRIDKKVQKTDGKQYTRINLGDKYDGANWAGTNKSYKCGLIVAEGQSAKAMITAGRPMIQNGADRYGIFAIRGKLINASKVSSSKLNQNEEIVMLKKILGASYGTDYSKDENFNTLRYKEGIYIMCDADVDGYHIRGLLINAIYQMFPGLVERGFVKTLITPVVKVSLPKKKVIEFYTESDYKKWLENNVGKKGEYYKGLGHFDSNESKEYFKDWKCITYKLDSLSPKKMELAFGSNSAQNRKEWISEYDEETLIMDNGVFKEYVTPLNGDVCINYFIDRELVLYALETLDRAIPNIYDGFKESSRKVFFGTLKKKIKSDTKIKVEQLAGYISEQTQYHHGEKNLYDTIVGMAQGFVGSNNIPLLQNLGMFGTRLGGNVGKKGGISQIRGGADAAAARYIATKLDDITRFIFRPEDDDLLEKKIDDGVEVEPIHYMPIIPMILINGANGIGFGYSTFIPQYNPMDILKWIKIWINGISPREEAFPVMIPWYRGFTGEIKVDNKIFITSGKMHCEHSSTADKVSAVGRELYHVTELPIGLWTNSFKILLEEKFVKSKLIVDFKTYNTDNSVHFILHPSRDFVPDIDSNFKCMHKQYSMANMVAIDEHSIPLKYENVEEILHKFCIKRLDLYILRKKNELIKMEHMLRINKNKFRFIKEIISDHTLILFNRDEEELFKEMEEKKYDKEDNKYYTYLVEMPIRSMTKQKLATLAEHIEKLNSSIIELNKKTEKELWLNDLAEFENAYKKFLKTRVD